jgi:hypothetical protein
MTRQPTPNILADVGPPTPDDLAAAILAPLNGGERIQEIDPLLLHFNPYQQRSNTTDPDDDPALVELIASIATSGIIQPLVVRPHPERAGYIARWREEAPVFAFLDRVGAWHSTDCSLQEVFDARFWSFVDMIPPDWVVYVLDIYTQ